MIALVGVSLRFQRKYFGDRVSAGPEGPGDVCATAISTPNPAKQRAGAAARGDD